MSKVDPAVFYRMGDSCKVKGILASHVNVFIWGGTDAFSTTVIPQLKAAFQVGREEHDSFSYIRIEVHSLEDEKHVHIQICNHFSRFHQSNTV